MTWLNLYNIAVLLESFDLTCHSFTWFLFCCFYNFADSVRSQQMSPDRTQVSTGGLTQQNTSEDVTVSTCHSALGMTQQHASESGALSPRKPEPVEVSSSVCHLGGLKRHSPLVTYCCKIMLISISYNYCSVLTASKCFIVTELTS